MSFTNKIALVGRTNVGKSTLFNCFAKQEKAVVHDEPGVTRDCKVESITFGGYDFTLIDTPGIDIHEDKELKKHIIQRIEETVKTIDLIWFIVDGTCGILGQDRAIATLLRKTGKPVIIVANKADHKNFEPDLFFELGFEEVVSISAAHQMGITNLLDTIKVPNDIIPETEEIPKEKIVILGKPNAGKSTFINTILGKEYQLTGDTPGITRESVTFPFTWNNKDYALIDTAGIRKKQKVTEALERKSVKSALESLKFAHGVIYLLDATTFKGTSIDQQDINMIHKIIEEGRCLIIGLSKWDQVKNSKATLNEIHHFISQKGFHFIPIIPISSYQNKGFDSLFQTLSQSLSLWRSRISTGKLNQWLKKVLQIKAPPSIKGRPVKLKFITQVQTNPPRFFVSVNSDGPSLESYKKFIINQFYETFQFQGVPIRIFFRTAKNPYT